MFRGRKDEERREKLGVCRNRRVISSRELFSHFSR